MADIDLQEIECRYIIKKLEPMILSLKMLFVQNNVAYKIIVKVTWLSILIKES